MKNMKKAVAVAMSAAMAMGMAVPAMADDVSVPIYAFDVVNVVVPTTYEIALNPEKLQVETGGAAPSTDQVLSRNFGIINKSNKDKLITVKLTVEDENGKITFVDAKSDIDSAAAGEYKVHLTAIPADGTEVEVGAAGSEASATAATTAEDLKNVKMTKAADTNAVTLKAGSNKLKFKLAKATFSPKDGNKVTLGTSTANDVKDNYEITALAGDGKSITAFTLSGEVNENADWHELQKGIKISVTYGNKTAVGTDTVVTGTGAMVAVVAGTAPTFTAGTNVGEITYTAGTGDEGLDTIKKVEMTNDGGTFDGYNAADGFYTGATDDGSTITLASDFLAYYTGDTCKAVITYTTKDGDEKMAEVDVKLSDTTTN